MQIVLAVNNKSFTWYRLEEGIFNKVLVLAEEGSLASVCKDECWVGHTTHAYLYGPNCEVSHIGK
jgi:hypothetical protein